MAMFPNAFHETSLTSSVTLWHHERVPEPTLSDLAAILGEMRAEMDEMRAEMREMRAEMGGITSRLIRVEDRLEHVNDRVGVVGDRLGGMNDRLMRLEEETHGIRTRLTTLEEFLVDFRAEFLNHQHPDAA
jgi:predicted nuclease with TOPRIM domain